MEEPAERYEKKEVIETFCKPLKDKRKDKCVLFYEELAEAEQDKNHPDEK